MTQALIEARSLSRYEFSKLAAALDWNRRVWQAFANDCSVDGNNLPHGLRAGVISLAIFVAKHSSVVLRGGGDIEPLIDINRTVMQGLEQAMAAARAGSAAPAA